jgi:hypothetical protein
MLGALVFGHLLLQIASTNTSMVCQELVFGWEKEIEKKERRKG